MDNLLGIDLLHVKLFNSSTGFVTRLTSFIIGDESGFTKLNRSVLFGDVSLVFLRRSFGNINPGSWEKFRESSAAKGSGELAVALNVRRSVLASLVSIEHVLESFW